MDRIKFAIILLGFVTACGNRQPVQASAEAGGRVDASALAEVLKTRDMNGAVVTIPADAKVVVMPVFASWCGHCRHELAALVDIRSDHPDVHLLGLNAFEEFRNLSDQQRLKTYLAELAPWMPVVVSTPTHIKALGGVSKIPTVFIFNRRGRLVHRVRPSGPRSETRERLLSLIDDARQRP